MTSFTFTIRVAPGERVEVYTAGQWTELVAIAPAAPGEHRLGFNRGQAIRVDLVPLRVVLAPGTVVHVESEAATAVEWGFAVTSLPAPAMSRP